VTLRDDVVKAAHTFQDRLDRIVNDFVGREEALTVVALAALCQEHVLLVGPPGTGKTSLLDRFAGMLDAKVFSHLLTKFTEPHELFGPLDVDSFLKEHEYRVSIKGMLPTAEIAFLDEIFQGSSAILNTLLTIINERRFFNGYEKVPVDLVTVLGATNDIPDDAVLRAFADRFLFRHRLSYVAVDEIDDLLTRGWKSELRLLDGDGRAPDGRSRTAAAVQTAAEAAQVRFPLKTLRLLHRSLGDVDIEPVRGTLVEIIREFRAEGVRFSDRRAVKAQKAVAASALLGGRGQAERDDLAALVHLWADPADEKSIRRIVSSRGIALDGVANEPRHLAEIRGELRTLSSRIGTVATRHECAEIIRLLGRLARELADRPDGADALAEVKQEQRRAIVECRERFPDEGRIDV
jgi:MoxR-like ATPase